VTPTENMLGLVTSPAKLQSYIDVVLAPMVKMFASIPSLGGFEVRSCVWALRPWRGSQLNRMVVDGGAR